MEQARVYAGFLMKNITKKYVNMTEYMKISDTIYKGVIEPSYKKPLENILTVLFVAFKRGEYPLRQKLNRR